MSMVFEAHPGLWAGWAKLAEDESLLASPPWLEMRAPKMDGDTATFVVGEGGSPVAGVFATVAAAGTADPAFDVRQLLTGYPRTLMTDWPGRDVRDAMRAASDDLALWYPHLAVAYPGYESFVAGHGSASPAAVAELVDGILGWSRDEGLWAVAFLYTVPARQAMEEALRDAGFLPFHVTSTSDLELAGSGFEDYLGRLPRKQRTEIRRERRLLAGRGITTGQVELTEVLDELIRLRLQHAARYGRRVSEEKERGRLATLVELFGRESVLVFAAARADGAVLGFCVVLEYRGEWYVLDSGSDYGDPLHRLTYFEACYYAPISSAYERGVRTLHYSLGSWDAKRHRGCALVPRGGWVKALTPELDGVLVEWTPRFARSA